MVSLGSCCPESCHGVGGRFQKSKDNLLNTSMLGQLIPEVGDISGRSRDWHPGLGWGLSGLWDLCWLISIPGGV